MTLPPDLGRSSPPPTDAGAERGRTQALKKGGAGAAAARWRAPQSGSVGSGRAYVGVVPYA